MCAVSYLFTILSLPEEIKCFRTETIKPSKLQEESVFRFRRKPLQSTVAHCGFPSTLKLYGPFVGTHISA